jgi:transcriptional regulator with XRE-family HTH domain
MRLFEERVGISPSYIHSIEKQGLLPTPEKLDLLASVFIEVATEQEAASPEEDARKLFRAREKSLMEERLGLEPGIADVVLAIQDLKQDQRTDVLEPLKGSIGFFGTLRTQERRALARLLQKVLAVVGPLSGSSRTDAILTLSEAADEALDKVAEETGKVGSSKSRARDRTTANASRGRSTVTGAKQGS